MTQIRVDDELSEIEMGIDGNRKVGECLKTVFSHLPENRIVTQITVDGVSIRSDEGNYERSVNEVKEVEVRTADREIWAATGLDIALSCLERVQSSLIRTAELFRFDDKARANRFFAQCMEGLERFVETITITRCALKLDFSRIKVDGYTLSNVETSMNQILRSLLESQERSDFDAIADKVEYELITNLSSWKTALKQLRQSNESNA